MPESEPGETASQVETELNRDIGTVGAVALGVGTMIAAGIFVLSGLAVSNVGAMAIVAFLIAAVVAAFTAFAYAEFASIYPESGGGYAYCANVFDTDLTYIVGWSMILGYPASAAFYLASFSDWFFRFMYPALDIPAALPYWIPGLAILGLLVSVNLKGTEETGAFQIVVTALKVGLIIVFLYGGLQAFDGAVIAESFAANAGAFKQIGLTSALVFITFFGFEAIATNAEEIEEPGSTVPKAIFISMGFVSLVYALVVLVVVLAVNDPEFLTFLADKAGLGSAEAARSFVAHNGEVSMGRAAQYYLGNVGFYVIIVGALFSMISAANATVMAGSRVKLAMSRRNHLPSTFEDLHDRFNTPHKAVGLTGGLILAFLLLFTVLFGEVPGSGEAHNPLGLHLGIEALAHFADFMLLIGLVFVNLAVIRSRRKDPDIERGFEVPGVPYVPILAVLANLALLVNVDPASFAVGVVAQVVGVGFWFAWKGGAPSLEEIEEETPTVVTREEGLESDHEILVPIGNPEHTAQLMRTAIHVAKHRGGTIRVLNVIQIPEQTPLSEGRQLVDDRRPLLNAAMEYARDEDVPVSATIRIGHHASTAIINTVEQHDSDAVLLGWKGRRYTRRDKVLGTTVDEVVQGADADVLVEKIGAGEAARPGGVESVLLPTAGGPHADLAAEAADAVAAGEGARVHLVEVVPRGATEEERGEARAFLEEVAEGVHADDVALDIVEGDDVADALVDEAARHDLVVLGASEEGLLQQVVFGSIPEEIADRSPATVLMVRRNLPLRSRLARYLGIGDGGLD